MNGAVPEQVVLAAGGTGGHMFPAEALAREMIARGSHVVLVTDRRGGGFGAALPEVETHHISGGGVAGGSIPKRVKGLAQLIVGYFQSRRLLKRLGAEVVVGFGGYASVPTALAGAHLGLRLVVHEQNAVAGRANRLLARRAQVIATSFARVSGLAAAQHAKVTMTGNPVRQAISEIGQQPYSLPGASGPFHLLVTGGSQGARAFNDVIPAAIGLLPETLRRRLDVSQQVQGDVGDEVAAVYRGCGVTADLAGFFTDMAARLARAHLVICRAGASTVAELTAAGRPAIFVPYPHATDNHQTANARALADAGAGWLLPEPSLTPAVLAGRLESLLSTPALLGRAAKCTAAYSGDDAARRLADVVCGALGTDGNGRGDPGTRREVAA